MNFLKLYLAWILGGDLSSHTERCENKHSGETGFCTSIWSCTEIVKGINIGKCKKEQSEDICCKIKRFDEADILLTNKPHQEAGPSPHSVLLQNDLSADALPPSSPVRGSKEKEYASVSISGLSNDYNNHATKGETYNTRETAQLIGNFDLSPTANIDDSVIKETTVQTVENIDTRLPVKTYEIPIVRKPIPLANDFDLRHPVIVEESHNSRKPVQLAKDFDLRRPVKIEESHDLRWPVLEEETHDLRNPHHSDEFLQESEIARNEDKQKRGEPLESRNFNNFYEYLASQGFFKDFEENFEINKECLKAFHESNKNGSIEHKEQINFPNKKLLISSEEICGVSFSKTMPKLVGGKDSSYLQWPWMVSLRKRRQQKFWHKCGAALLNKYWVITVAHCVEFLPPWDVSLRLGSYDLKRLDEPHSYIIRTVDKIILHPKFNTNTFDNDVALLLMSSPVEFGPNISPICMPKKVDHIEGTTAVVLGWGRKPETRLQPANLKELSLPVMSNRECEKMYSKAGIDEKILDNFFCAGTSEGGSDTCDGDSGGPMSLRNSEGRWSLIGLVSWGGICGAPNQPGVYTRIKNYVEWIEGTVVCYQYR